jgi:curved DNA-binding protein CbpA
VGGSDLYRLLGLEPGASPEQVERAYRFCLELYGETSVATYSLLEPSEAEELRSRVSEAHDVLADPERRRAYDAALGFATPDATGAPLPPPAVAPAGPPMPSEVTGSELRRVREARGVSLRHIAAVTKIGVRFLEYIEDDRFAYLPPPVYLRGFLQEYARLVGLDPREVADRYIARIA